MFVKTACLLAIAALAYGDKSAKNEDNDRVHLGEEHPSTELPHPWINQGTQDPDSNKPVNGMKPCKCNRNCKDLQGTKCIGGYCQIPQDDQPFRGFVEFYPYQLDMDKKK